MTTSVTSRWIGPAWPLAEAQRLRAVGRLQHGVAARRAGRARGQRPHAVLVLDQQHRLRAAGGAARPARPPAAGAAALDPRQVDPERRAAARLAVDLDVAARSA